MFPVIRPELADHSKAVWCSPIAQKAWLDVALRGNSPKAPANLRQTRSKKNVELGRKLGVNSTAHAGVRQRRARHRRAGQSRLTDLLDIKP